MTAAAVGSRPLLPPGLELSDARRRLFEAGIVLFGERSYDAVSVRDIATYLGLKPMALYAHVSSKQELLFELMKIGYLIHRDRVRDALLGAGSDPKDQIQAITRAHVLVHLDYPALARVTNREAGALTVEQTAAVITVRTESANAFLDVIERGQRLGVFTEVKPHLAVHAVAALGIRAAEWWTPEEPDTAADVADTYAHFALRLLT
jgi:AcrR family transcriptional regulator